jgi:hypothetical protein
VSERTGILFLNSPERPGAVTWVQNLIIRHLDRARFEVHPEPAEQEDRHSIVDDGPDR